MPRRPNTPGHLAAGLLLVALSGPPAEAADWPQYRGPVRQGTVDEPGLLPAWGEGQPREVWRRPIGGGYSGVTVVGDRLYTMDATEGSEAVLCLDVATGETVWRQGLGEPLPAELGDPGPRSTPAVAGDLLYAVSSQSRLVALATADGRPVWEKDLTEWAKAPRFGYSVSPLVDGELVIVDVGGEAEGESVAAFDRRSGELRWTALDGPPGYSSPIVAEIGGRKQYVYSRRASVVALSPAGETLWRHETGRRTAIPMPLFLPPDRLFVASADDSHGGVMLRVTAGEGGAFETETAWSERLMRNHFNTSVAVGGAIYGFDNATLKCLDGETGERCWAKRGFGKGSLIGSGGLLFVLGDDGTLALVEATPERFVEKGRIQATEGRTWTEPTLAGGRIYVRDFDEIVSLEVGAGSSAVEPRSTGGASR